MAFLLLCTTYLYYYIYYKVRVKARHQQRYQWRWNTGGLIGMFLYNYLIVGSWNVVITTCFWLWRMILLVTNSPQENLAEIDWLCILPIGLRFSIREALYNYLPNGNKLSNKTVYITPKSEHITTYYAR